MRCLYCGKELALLKRWTGGGEFCSDAHRQQYQEEYNQLALNRLLQAKPLGSGREAAEPPPAPRPVAVEAPEPVPRVEIPEPEIARLEIPEPQTDAREIPQPEPEPAVEEDPAPAEPYGFLLELPVPVDAPLALAAMNGAFEAAAAPELPSRNPAAWETDIALAGKVALAPGSRIFDCAARMAERRLEIRDLLRAAPVLQFDLAPAGETGLVQTAEVSMDILIFPQPPPASPPLWQANAAEFAFGCELGAMARATFRTTGVEDKDDNLAPMAAESTLEEIRFSEPARPEPAIAEAPAPVPVKTAVAPPVFRPAPAAAAPAEPEKRAEPEKKHEPVPDLITRPLPLTLHGLAAGRGKPVQVFQGTVAGDLEIQTPRSSALPLRPMMTLGPASAPSKSEERKSERTVVVKTDVKKPDGKQGRTDPRFADARGRKQEPAPAPEPKVAAKPEPKPEPKPQPVVAAASAVEPKPEPKPAPPPESKPAPNVEPVPTPYTSVDLGLPKLTVESGGFWSKLPAAGRIGIAAAAVLAVTGIAVLALRSGGSTVVANSPQVVAGSPLPAPETGWITDWGAEAGVRREHDISILRPSLSLSDYRIEFEAEIESKAIGWVFRAADGKNYYVAKLEVVTPGLEPTVDAVHFAVIDGQAQQHVHTPLPMKVRIDTLYKVRFDAVGDHFSTWVQDQKVDDWTDDRLKTGGIGLYNDRGERMTLKGGVSVVPLVIKR